MNEGRIYHHYEKWEDHKCGFYNNCSGEVKEKKINEVIEMFTSKQKTVKYMQKVIDEWKYSCEQNFTNPAINKIAYLGQAACCLYSEIPNTVTMEAWSLLTIKHRNQADDIAKQTLNQWIENNKSIQLCLNIN